MNNIKQELIKGIQENWKGSKEAYIFAICDYIKRFKISEDGNDTEQVLKLANKICDDYIALCKSFRISQSDYMQEMSDNVGTQSAGYKQGCYRILNDNGTEILNNVTKLKEMIKEI